VNPPPRHWWLPLCTRAVAGALCWLETGHDGACAATLAEAHQREETR